MKDTTSEGNSQEKNNNIFKPIKGTQYEFYVDFGPGKDVSVETKIELLGNAIRIMEQRILGHEKNY